MSNQGKSRKPLIIGVVAAVVILAVLLVLLLTNCTGGQGTESTQTTGPAVYVPENADLYWNVDRAQYDGMSEGGMSSRRAESDGYFHIRFFKDGQMVELRTEEKSLVNKIDAQDIMGLVFDDNGIIVDMIPIEQMPVEKVGWKFYVQSTGGNIIKVNSSDKFNGLEVLLEKGADTKVYDMTGTAGAVGIEAEAVLNDRVMAVADLEGNLLAVYIYDRSNMVVEFQAYCQHCDEEVTWIEWSNAKQLPKEGGHFQLVTDIQLNAQQSIKADAKICLDLNGHTVDGKEGARVYSLHNQNCELAIMDTSEEQTGRLAGHGEVYAQGAVVWVRYGAAYLYSGTLDASDVVCTGRGGAAVYIPKERFFYMHGGEIIGGTAKYYFNEETGKYTNGLGGGVYVLGKFVLHDGVIRDGIAQSTKVYSNGKTSYQRGIGGNIYVGSGGVFEMNGGTVKNGKAGAAGNIYLDGTAEFTMNDGVISGGRAVDPGRQGGNLNIGAKATFTMNGGTISYGTTSGNSGNVYLSGTYNMNGGLITAGRVLDPETGKVKEGHASSNAYIANGAKFEMYGGTIHGGVSAIDSSTTDGKYTRMVLSGLATIYGAQEGSPNLTLYAGKEPVRVIVGVLLDKAKVGITAAGKFSLETKQSNQDNFYSDIPEAEVLYVDSCLALGKLACLCGSTTDSHLGECDGTKLLWSPWTTNNGLPGSDGNYYLVTDVAYTRSKSLGSADAFCKINLDLNGHSIVSQQRAFTLYGTMNLVDHKGNGQIVGAGMENGKNHSGAVIVYLDSKLDIYGGTLKLADKHYNITNAGVMAVAAGATVTMYGGTVDARSLDATGKDTDTTGTIGDGGALRVHGTVNILGGTVYGGTANRGGAFYVEKNGVLNISAGTVYGGSAEQGGVAYVTGKNACVNISGGTLEGGSSTKDGGVIRLLGNATVNITGGTIRGGAANGSGGNIGVASGVLNISGGQLLGGKATATGGNINATGGTVNISGGQISGGEARGSADNHSANIMIRDAALNLSGGTIAGSVLVQNASEEIKTALTLSGEPVVTRPGTYGLRLFGNNAAEPDLNIQGTLGEKASIEIDATDVFSTKTVAANEDKFVPADDLDVIHFGDDECLFVGRVHCLCESGSESWCDHKDVRWSKWDGKSDLTEGNYYLTGDVNVTSAPDIGEKGKNVNICLNGKTITAKNRAMLVFGNVSIYDHGEGKGTILGIGKEGDHSAVAVVREGGVLNLYKGTLKLAENHNNLGNGGIISVAAGGEMNIYGGSVDASASLNSEKTIASGAAIRVSGTLNVLGGSVVGGKAAKGGTISVQKGGSAVISGGTVGGGSATTGGTVSVENGALTISGGTVSGGSAKNGGTVSVEKGTLTVSGGTVSGGQANEGGSIYANGGSITVSGGTVNGGSAATGGTVTLRDAEMTVSSGTVNGGTATAQGGTVYITGTEALLTVSGGKLVGGTAADGGAIRQLGSATVKISGGSVEGGTATGTGGNISVVSGLLEISGGSVLSGTAATTGGNINVTGGTLHISGGTVSGGSARDSKDNHSANIMVRNAALKLSGGTVEGGLLVQNTTSESVATVTLSGEPVVTRPGTYGLRLLANGGDEPDVTIEGTLGEKASIEIDATDVFSTKTVAENESKFIPADDLDVIHFGDDECLFVGRVHCKCETGTADWCDHKQLRWSKWNGKSSLTEGNYYLTADATVTSLLTLGETGKTLNICLNGMTLTGSEKADRIANVYGTVNIFDHSDQKGTLVGVSKGTSHSAVAIVQKDAQLNLYGGTLKLADDHRALTNLGGVVSVIGGGELNLYGGCIDASASLTSANTIGAGGAVRVSGTLNLLGGKIIGGKVTGNGGAILAKSGSTVNITKGTVSGGEAGGLGNGIYTEANVTLSVSSGTVDSIAVDNGNTMQLSGDPAIGTLELMNGSKVQILSALTGDAGSITLSGVEGLFADGACQADGEKFVSQNTDLVVGLVGTSQLATGKMRCLCGTGTQNWCGEHEKTFWLPWDGTTTLTDGNYYLTKTVTDGAIQKLSGKTVNLDLMGLSYEAAERAFQLSNSAKLTIVDSTTGEGTITGKGNVSKADAGGVIHVNGATLNIYSGTVRLAAEHNAITEGGVLVIGGKTSVVNIYDGTIGGATTSGTVTSGGAIRIGGGQLTVSGGKVVGNETTTNGGTIYIKGGSVAVSGTAIIEGGKATGKGGSIYLDAGSLEVSGTAIIRGGEASQGGNIASMEAPVTINGGTISGGTAGNQNNGNLYVNNAVLTLGGGTIGGGVSVINNANTAVAGVILSGDPEIKDGTTNLRLARVGSKPYPTVTVTGELTCADGSIGLTGLGEGVYADSTIQTNAAKFFDDTNTYASVFHQNQLLLARVRCLCGAAEGLSTAYDSVTHKTWCDATMGMTPWLPWDGTTTLTDGNYYLTKTVTDGANQKLSGKTVNLDLMGLSYEATERAFQLSNSAKLTIVNSTTDEGSITGKGLVNTNSGGVIHVNGATLNIYSGTVKLAAEHNEITEGGVIVVGGKTSVVNITGGTVGGTTTSGAVTVGGGAIRLGNGTMTISGDAVINGHNAATNGGAIYVTGGTLNVTGGTINGSTVTGVGGAIYQTAGSVNISNGTVASGDVYTKDSVLTVSGGSISEITLANSLDEVAADLQLSGAPTIGAVKLVGLDGKAAPTVTIAGQLTGGTGSIGVTAGQGVFATGAAETDAEKFASNDASLSVTYYNSELHLTGVSCLCGAAKGASAAYDSVTHADWCKESGQGMLSWLPWDGTTAVTEGNYYLTGENTASPEKAFEAPAGNTLNLCLNGQTLTVTSTNGAPRLFNVKGTLNITDWSATPGSIIGTGKVNEQSAVALVYDGGELNLYRGSLKLAENHENLNDLGGVASVAAGGVMNIYEGCVDASASLSSQNTVGSGAAIRVDGELNVYGGSVVGGKVTNKGGAILLRKSTSVVNISGGTITGGTAANGGAICVTDGELNISGGTVTGGTATNGGAIYQAAGTVKISDKAVINGSAVTGSGGTIYVESGELNVTGGTVNNGTVAAGQTDAAVGNGPTIYMAAGTVKLNGGTLGATTTDTIGTRGGIVYVAGGQLNIGGATINGATTTRAGSIWVNGGTVTMTSGTINGGKSISGSGHGGSVYIASGATFQLQGGTVQNGVSTKNGGNFAVNGTLEISGGTVKNGSGNVTETNHGSANIYVNGTDAYPDAFLKISGGTIDGGISVVTGTATGDNKPTVELSGTPQISNNGNGLNLGKTTSTSKPIQIVGALSDANGNKASVAVNLGNSQNTGVFAVPATGVTLSYADKACFTSDRSAYQVAFYGDRLELVSKDALATCACATTDGNHADWCTQLDPVAWTGTGLPTEGSYYLTAPVEVSAVTQVTGKLNLWLQDNDITISDEYVPDATLKNEYVFYVDDTGSLALLDNAEDAGTIYASENTFEIIRSAGTLVVDGVNLDASAVTAGTAQGLAVYVGEADYPNSLFLLKDGTITGGTTTGWGGAVYVVGGSTMKMSGGTITGGTALCGGNIGTRGTVEITGGSVTNGRYTGSSSRGGNICAGTADNPHNYIASVAVSGKVTISGGYTNATTKALTDRANICCWNANLSLTDVELEGGVYMAGTGYTATLSGVVKIAGGDKLAMSVTTTVKNQTISTIKADDLAAGSSVNIVVHSWANAVDNVYVTGLAKSLAEDTENPVFTCVTSGYSLKPVLEENGETYKLVLAK